MGEDSFAVVSLRPSVVPVKVRNNHRHPSTRLMDGGGQSVDVRPRGERSEPDPLDVSARLPLNLHTVETGGG